MQKGFSPRRGAGRKGGTNRTRRSNNTNPKLAVIRPVATKEATV